MTPYVCSRSGLWLGWLVTALLAVVLAGCSGYTRVKFIAVSEAELPKACPSLIGRSKGCTQCTDEGCTIYARAPKNLEDEDRLLTIGHEFYCHAWLRQSHYDSRGIQKDPSVDCKE